MEPNGKPSIPPKSSALPLKTNGPSQLNRARRIIRLFILPLVVLWLLAWVIVCQPIFPGGKKSAVSVDPEALKKHVRVISEDFFPRDSLNTGNLDRCSDYIRSEFEKTGAKIRVQEYSENGRTYRNVIARFGRSDEDLIVVGAHYDACGDTPGADDNASGVAGLIELAGILSRAPVDRNIELVAYSTEEPPYFRSTSMGSAVHAKEFRERGIHVRGVVILEMIGWFSDDWMSQDFPFPLLRLFYPSRGNYIAIVGKLDQWPFMRELKKNMQGATGLPVYSINAPTTLPGIDFSDHLNYWQTGCNAVMVTDTSFYRNRDYHDEGDVWARLDYKRMAEVVVAVYEGIKMLPAQK